MAVEFVRICPVCETENPPVKSLCACGASLASIDFSIKAEAPVRTPPEDESLERIATAQTLACPHADCAQINPAGTERCLYCNRPLAKITPSAVARLRWAWGEITPIAERLLIGREAPTPEALATRLEKDFDNVSRRHAEFVWRGGELWLTDLASLNGTFVDGVRLPAHQAFRLNDAQQVRFGADLTGQISLAPSGSENEQSDAA